MGEQKLRHIEILKTVPEIKEDIEKLKFGCIIEYDYLLDGKNKYGKILYTETNKKGTSYKIYYDKYNSRDIDDRFSEFKIIGQVEERHLRMFTNKKGIDGFWISDTGSFWKDENGEAEKIVELDNSKPYMEQSEEFFKQLNDWLVNEFNINL